MLFSGEIVSKSGKAQASQLLLVFSTLKVNPVLHLTSDQAPDIVGYKGGCLQLFVDGLNKKQKDDHPNAISKPVEILRVSTVINFNDIKF